TWPRLFVATSKGLSNWPSPGPKLPHFVMKSLPAVADAAGVSRKAPASRTSSTSLKRFIVDLLGQRLPPDATLHPLGYESKVDKGRAWPHGSIAAARRSTAANAPTRAAAPRVAGRGRGTGAATEARRGSTPARTLCPL